MRSLDVAIIGGSLAGSVAARELTRRGIDAVAFERDSFPREKVCGGFLSPGAVAILEAIGMMDAVRAAGATDVHFARVHVPGGERIVEFKRPGLGISRKVLDTLVADHPAVKCGNVKSVTRENGGFHVRLEDEEVLARVVIDAAGKLSRFTPRDTEPEFGVQFYDSSQEVGAMDFWFFREGYGGAVQVEGQRSNCCFLIRKAALPGYLGRPGCLVTGPVSYTARSSEWIAIGDAAGMVDPFCGEGMRHALDTGRIAAEVVARGVREGASYEQMRGRYELERNRRWVVKRRLASLFRRVVRRTELLARLLRLKPEWFLEKMWE